ncbi:hypothetical protein C0992_011900 [Termitomyces sp. T32_za158]|nr:hypothetical protein C0992_011900 [Termitomyces sp. T32_za158]
MTSKSPTRRLGLVFFDILSINSKSLLMTPYRTRRSILESLIRVIPGEFIQHYELRFPRVTKIHRRSDRPWTEGINLKDLHKIACAVVGRDTSDKQARDITAEMWGIPTSPGAHSALKRKATTDLWREKFATLDGRVAAGDTANHSASPSPSFAPDVTPCDADVFISRTKKRRISPGERSDIIDASPSSREPKGTTQPLKVKTNIISNQQSSSSGHQKSQNSNLEIPRSPPLTPQKLTPKQIRSVGPSSPIVLISPAPVCTRAVSISLFLQNALVWFAKPCDESWEVKNVVPREQRVHTVEAFLAGCGWCINSFGANWVEKGVIFVDERTITGKHIARSALKMIDDRLRVLPLDQPRKGIWILDQKRWTSSDETELHALYQYD